MVVIDYIDGSNRRIYLHSSTVNTIVHPIDIYKEMRTLRRTDETLREFDLFLSAHGNESKGGGKFTERFVKELLGTRIIPYDIDGVLTINGTIITDDGQEGIACFDRTILSPTSTVDINYVPPQVEIITVGGGGGVTAEEIAIAVWERDKSSYTTGTTFGRALKDTEKHSKESKEISLM